MVKGKLSMMPCHICHIYGIWRNKEVEGCFKVIIWGGNARHNWAGIFNGEKGVSTM